MNNHIYESLATIRIREIVTCYAVLSGLECLFDHLPRPTCSLALALDLGCIIWALRAPLTRNGLRPIKACRYPVDTAFA